MRSSFTAITLAAAFGFASFAESASLRVSPVIVDLPAPAATTQLSVFNDAMKPINVQVRIFKWSQKDGKDVLEPANGVAVSPPIAQLKPGGENMVRIVRTSKTPVKGEESYRVVVDELPPSMRQAITVIMVVRHSIPVFFADPSAAGAVVDWSVQPVAGGYQVTARNRGAKRFKVANLELKSGGSTVGERDGLVGYVLGGSTAQWIVPARGRQGGAITIHGESEAGSFDARAKPQGG
ncbi:molecular chaperone [Neorhizobium sp. NCHU2750]|uniref:fimbrial biogenesis chaperone n=1 Tax=Neorhizobium sp. NCHU2750 TaxID=1825976 RepID=UPI000E71AC59|nr:pilus assembly protein [Neorhizobium sp. NCHU2750]